MKKLILSVVLVLITVLSCKKPGQPPPTQEIVNLRAFAKLYGYVRYFHPSDEPNRIDFNWDKFLFYGIGKIRTVKNNAALETTLDSLFKPIAPTIQIYKSGESPRDFSSTLPKDTAGLHVVAWQHYGVG